MSGAVSATMKASVSATMTSHPKVTTVGAKYRVMPELMLSGRYGLFDPDRAVKGDGSQRVTLAAQYIFMQNGSLELFYWLNIANEDRDPTSTDRQLEGTDQLILMSHFWF